MSWNRIVFIAACVAVSWYFLRDGPRQGRHAEAPDAPVANQVAAPAAQQGTADDKADLDAFGAVVEQGIASSDSSLAHAAANRIQACEGSKGAEDVMRRLDNNPVIAADKRAAIRADFQRLRWRCQVVTANHVQALPSLQLRAMKDHAGHASAYLLASQGKFVDRDAPLLADAIRRDARAGELIAVHQAVQHGARLGLSDADIELFREVYARVNHSGPEQILAWLLPRPRSQARDARQASEFEQQVAQVVARVLERER